MVQLAEKFDKVSLFSLIDSEMNEASEMDRSCVMEVDGFLNAPINDDDDDDRYCRSGRRDDKNKAEIQHPAADLMVVHISYF